MSAADEEWYCRIEGRVEGPLTPRALKTLAALGELIPSDEIRKGLDGKWQPARTVQGLKFGSTIRKVEPICAEGDESPAPPLYRYKMIQMPRTIEIHEVGQKSGAAAMYLEGLVNEQASDGWEFYRIDTIGVQVRAGCLGALLLAFAGHQTNVTELYYVATFRKLVYMS